jgi:hypothetical protein
MLSSNFQKETYQRITVRPCKFSAVIAKKDFKKEMMDFWNDSFFGQLLKDSKLTKIIDVNDITELSLLGVGWDLRHLNTTFAFNILRTSLKLQNEELLLKDGQLSSF